MTRALSNDLRERVVAAVLAGESCRLVAARFGVAVFFGGEVVAAPSRDRLGPARQDGRRVLEPHRAFILERINQTSRIGRKAVTGKVDRPTLSTCSTPCIRSAVTSASNTSSRGRRTLADPRLEAACQTQDQLLHAGGLRRFKNVLRIGIPVETRDVIGHRPLEQLYVLRQVADVAAECLDIPLIERGLVEADAAAQRRPGTDKRARQRRLARRARPDHANRHPRQVRS
jgi:hypothetical protein